MNRSLTDRAARRGLFDGLVIGGVLVSVLVLANPGGPIQLSAATHSNLVFGMLLLQPVLYTLIGARGRRRERARNAGAKAGASAGFVIAAAIVGKVAVIDRLFFGAASHQYGLIGAVFLLVVLTCFGALFGEFGGSFASATC